MRFSLLFKYEKDALKKLHEAKQFFFENDKSPIGYMRRGMSKTFWNGDSDEKKSLQGLLPWIELTSHKNEETGITFVYPKNDPFFPEQNE